MINMMLASLVFDIITFCILCYGFFNVVRANDD